MPEQRVKKLTTDFSNNLKYFNEILAKIEQQPSSNKNDLHRLDVARKKIATSARAYFDDLGVKPNIIQLITPLISGELENVDQATAMNKIKQFAANLKKVTKEVTTDLESENEALLLDKYCTLQSSKDIPALKHKIEAIQNNFTAQLKKADAQKGDSGRAL